MTTRMEPDRAHQVRLILAIIFMELERRGPPDENPRLTDWMGGAERGASIDEWVKGAADYVELLETA